MDQRSATLPCTGEGTDTCWPEEPSWDVMPCETAHVPGFRPGKLLERLRLTAILAAWSIKSSHKVHRPRALETVSNSTHRYAFGRNEFPDLGPPAGPHGIALRG
jgi:hypothetical protein